MEIVLVFETQDTFTRKAGKDFPEMKLFFLLVQCPAMRIFLLGFRFVQFNIKMVKRISFDGSEFKSIAAVCIRQFIVLYNLQLRGIVNNTKKLARAALINVLCDRGKTNTRQIKRILTLKDKNQTVVYCTIIVIAFR